MGRTAATIRAGVPGDAEAIARVHVASWRVAYRGIVPDEHLDGLDWREWATVRREQLERAADEGVRVHVAVKDGGLVGFVATGPERDADASGPPCAEVYALYLAPRAWDQGVGRDLLIRAVADVPADTAVVLWVLSDNQRARIFYERQGFRADGAMTVVTRGGKELPELRYRLHRTSQVAKPSDR